MPTEQNVRGLIDWDKLANEYYSVTTDQIINRLQLATAVDGSFFDGILGTTNKPDMYGPIWIAVTAAVTIFTANSVRHIINKLPSSHHDYDILVSALLTIIAYVLCEGVGVYAICRYAFGANPATLELSPGLLVTLTGYAMVFLPPASMIACIPWPLLQTIALCTAGVMSCLFIYRNSCHVLQRQEGLRLEQASLLMTIWICCHASLFLLVKMRYF